MRILVTGGCGFIGSYLVAALKENPDNHIVNVNRRRKYNATSNDISADIANTFAVSSLMKSFQPEVIYHLAANPNVNIQMNTEEPFYVFRTNVEGTHNLLKYAPEGCIFVLASSATVYGQQDVYTCTEEDKRMPQSVYAASKVSAEALLEAYTSLGRVRGLSLRYVANVGKEATHGVVKAILEKLHSNEDTLYLLGESPGTRKPYMHVEDTVQATIEATKWYTYTGYEAINISPKDACTVKEIANTIMDTINVHKPIKWLGEESLWSGDQLNLQVDNTKLINDVGFKPKYKTSLEAIKGAVQ